MNHLRKRGREKQTSEPIRERKHRRANTNKDESKQYLNRHIITREHTHTQATLDFLSSDIQQRSYKKMKAVDMQTRIELELRGKDSASVSLIKISRERVCLTFLKTRLDQRVELGQLPSYSDRRSNR